MPHARSEVPLTDRWNVEALFSNPQEWKTAVDNFVERSSQTPFWPTLASKKGTLNQGPEKVKEVLELMFRLDRELSRLYTYAHLRHDENIADPEFKKADDQIQFYAHHLAQESSWFQPELLELEESVLEGYLKSPILKEHQFFLEKIIRLKKHTLTHDNEMIMALAGQALQSPHKAFSAINDADFKFGSVQDSKGIDRPISHATYSLYIRDQDRVLRERAFKKYHQQFSSYENTLCELLTGQVQAHQFEARARHYSSCLESALFPKNINTSVYYALIEAVNEKISVLHRYMDLRKRVLKVDQLHLYDVYVPLIKNMDIKMSYEEAEDIVIESVAPLGREYQERLAKGLKSDRWVDRYENQNKRSGAYSSGCYDSMPYILMNYKEVLRDVFTLAHEAGHSMHSDFSRHHQPYHYSDYPIFLAEVASTFNEDLLSRLLVQRCSKPEEKIFLINQQIEDIRATLFRQTMFAEFELRIHENVEKGIPLTPHSLKELYHQINQKYFGPHVIIDEEIDIEWARIPHFYYNFYVYQYATGVSAAIALAEKVVEGGVSDREAYLAFLKGGSSRYPIDMLKSAGINMESPEPVIAAIDKFDRLVKELDLLLTPAESRKEVLI